MALSCFLSRLTLHTWPSSEPWEADLCVLYQQVLCSVPSGLANRRLEGGKREKSQYVPPWASFLQGLAVTTFLYLKSKSIGFFPIAIALIEFWSFSLRLRDHNDFLLLLVPGELHLPFWVPLTPPTHLWTISSHILLNYSLLRALSFSCWDSGWFKLSFYLPVLFPTNVFQGTHWPHISQIPQSSQFLAFPSGWKVLSPFSVWKTTLHPLIHRSIAFPSREMSPCKIATSS